MMNSLSINFVNENTLIATSRFPILHNFKELEIIINIRLVYCSYFFKNIYSVFIHFYIIRMYKNANRTYLNFKFQKKKEINNLDYIINCK